MYVLTCADCGHRLPERPLANTTSLQRVRDAEIRMLHHVCTERLEREREERRLRRVAGGRRPEFLNLPEGADPIAWAHQLFPSLDFTDEQWTLALSAPVVIDEWDHRASSIEHRGRGKAAMSAAQTERRRIEHVSPPPPLRGRVRRPLYRTRAGKYHRVTENGEMAKSTLYPDCPFCKDTGPHRILVTTSSNERWACGACGEVFEIQIMPLVR